MRNVGIESKPLNVKSINFQVVKELENYIVTSLVRSAKDVEFLDSIEDICEAEGGLGESTPKEDGTIQDRDYEKSNCEVHVKVNEQNDGDGCDVVIGCDVDNGPKSLGSIGLHKAPLHDFLNEQTEINGHNEDESNYGVKANLETHVTNRFNEVDGIKNKDKQYATKPIVKETVGLQQSNESGSSFENSKVKRLGEKLGFKWVDDKVEKATTHLNGRVSVEDT
nr:hypothetical protein [Tanacetum cinerariifolium]